jgi:hypothetical protein
MTRMPSWSDIRIEELCSRIRTLCSPPISRDAEEELRRLAVELRAAIDEHVQMAKSSLGAKKSALLKRDEEDLKSVYGD